MSQIKRSNVTIQNLRDGFDKFGVTPQEWLRVLQDYEVYLNFSNQFQEPLGHSLQPLMKHLNKACKNSDKVSCRAKEALQVKLRIMIDNIVIIIS